MVFGKCLKRKHVQLLFIFTVMPLFVAEIYLKIIHPDFELFSSYPYYSDEWAYWKQIEAIITCGQPLGYWGYNGTHALVGHFGPHGAALLLPYALFGPAFGWNIHTTIICNIAMLCFANLLFGIIADCDRKAYIKLIVAQFFLYVKFQYSVNGMTESLKYALAILLAAMLYRIWKGKGGSFFKYIIFPVTLLFAIQCYLLFAAVVPIYLWEICKIDHVIRKYICIVTITVLVAIVSYMIWRMIAAPTPDGTIQRTISGLTGWNGIFQILKSTYKHITDWCNKIRTIEFLSWYILIYLELAFMSLAEVYICRKKSAQIIWAYIAWILFAFPAGYFVLAYTYSWWTTIRGINTALVFGVYLLCCQESNKEWQVFILVSFLAFPCNYQTWKGVITDKRFAGEESETEISRLSQEFDMEIDIDVTEDPWRNTISVVNAKYDGADWVFALPKGMGVNTVFVEDVELLSKYVLLGNSDTELEIKWQQKLEENYEIIVEKDDYSIYEIKEK